MTQLEIPERWDGKMHRLAVELKMAGDDVRNTDPSKVTRKQRDRYSRAIWSVDLHLAEVKP